MHTELLQASMGSYPHFTLPKNRSTGFRSYPRDLWHFHTTPLTSCGISLSLRIPPCHIDTLPGTLFKTNGRTSKGTTTLLLLGFRSFNSLLRVLFNIPSRYSFAIGLKTYLVLGLSAPHIHASFPGDTTQDTSKTIFLSFTGLSPSKV